MAKKEKKYKVLVAFEIDGVGRWEVDSELSDGDVPAESIKALLAEGDIEAE